MGITGKKKVRDDDDDAAWRTTNHTHSPLLVFLPRHYYHHHHHHHHRLTRAAALSLSLSLFLFLLFFFLQRPSSRLFLRRGSLTYHNKGGILVVRSPPPFALQGMGLLHRRGTRAMPSLVVVHVPEDATEDGVRFSLRSLHRSGVTARSDVVLVLPDRSSSDGFTRVIREENDAFLRLLDRERGGGKNRTLVQKKASAGNALSFDSAPFVRTSRRRDKDAGDQPPWGRRKRSDPRRANARWSSYGSVVSFEAGELDPEGSLSGFLDRVPMSLWRWSCYPMLLGRLRRNFKHVMLVESENWVVVNDPFVIRMRNRSSETVILWSGTNPGERRSKGRGRRELIPGVVVGGMRGVRRMAEAMQTGIANAAIRMMMQQQQKEKGGGRRKAGETTVAAAVTESSVMSQVVGRESLRKNVDLVVAPRDNDVASTLELATFLGNNNKWLIRVENNEYGEIGRLICWSEEEEAADMS